MRNASFVTWMLGWPIFDAGAEYFHIGFLNYASEWAQSVLLVTIWVAVGWLLYEPVKKKKK